MGKGKVHPSPSPSPAAAPAAGGGGAGAGGEVTAEAVLMRLLPAAVLAAAAPLGAEAKEVLAYLVLASLRSSAPPTPVPARGGDGKAAGEQQQQHGPELGCGCFGCYTAYWSRWDGSPEADRDAIHRAIEAFEEHLLAEEEERGRGGGKGGGGGGGGRRGRKKRAGAAAAAKDADAAEKEKKAGKGKAKGKKGKEVAVDRDPLPSLPLPNPPADLPAAAEEAPKAEDGADYLTAEDEKEAEEASTAAAGAEEEKRRRGWASVLSWKPWGLWGSH